jgi:hypothetical protein
LSFREYFFGDTIVLPSTLQPVTEITEVPGGTIETWVEHPGAISQGPISSLPISGDSHQIVETGIPAALVDIGKLLITVNPLPQGRALSYASAGQSLVTPVLGDDIVGLNSNWLMARVNPPVNILASDGAMLLASDGSYIVTGDATSHQAFDPLRVVIVNRVRESNPVTPPPDAIVDWDDGDEMTWDDGTIISWE